MNRMFFFLRKADENYNLVGAYSGLAANHGVQIRIDPDGEVGSSGVARVVNTQDDVAVLVADEDLSDEVIAATGFEYSDVHYESLDHLASIVQGVCGDEAILVVVEEL